MVQVIVLYDNFMYIDIELDTDFKKTVKLITGVAEESQILTAKGAWEGTLHIEDLNTLSIKANQVVTLTKKEAREENIRDIVSATTTNNTTTTTTAAAAAAAAAATDGDDGDLHYHYPSKEVKSKVCIHPDNIFITPMKMSLRAYIESKSKQDEYGKLVIPDGFSYPLFALNALKDLYSMGLPTVTGINNLAHYLKNCCDAIPPADKNIVAWSAKKLTWPGIFYCDDSICNNEHSHWDWWLIEPAQRFKKALDQQKNKRAAGSSRAGKDLSKSGKYYQSIVQDLQGLGFYTKNNFLFDNGEPRFDKPSDATIMYDEEFVLRKKQPIGQSKFDFDWSTHGFALWKSSHEFETLQVQLEPLFEQAKRILP